MKRFLPRAGWYAVLLLLLMAAFIFPSAFMVNAVASLVGALLPLTISFLLFDFFLRGFPCPDDSRKVLGVPTDTLGCLILSHGIFMLLVYAFTHDLLVAKIGCLLTFAGMEMVLSYGESQALRRQSLDRAVRR